MQYFRRGVGNDWAVNLDFLIFENATEIEKYLANF